MKAAIQIQLLSQAEKLCQQRHARMTPQRLEVLRLMIKQNNAISAYELLDLLRKSEPQAKPPTIYRALDFLMEQGFIHRVESTNSFMLCHDFTDPSHTSAFFICDRCGHVTEKTAENIRNILQKMAAKASFTMSYNVVETHGVCPQCR
ncbi:zinc uptake transcriptional repressor Zur [Candidatus Palibaumannia cicadellinicola]|uniref:Ferric uptake regulation protein n=1 Tax=Baumannia cicadellinicola subsp. Homalodisca coagulata TaxID=374463 RepID=Q1LSZ1_BAUCH|nr:zinc uptake transcriptional repressor Zur [Candidatus Baumannia cicadellinicola]ABF14218.1 zinc uptake regulation protein [Baumannia cicadellinicola str. Hc (Homalodisca coagulata)]MBS0032760.1 zinc uptake transcriptional repressor Zur [Candidatus Baumannia cicadellinicola]MCJ7462039.1 zinc uptake transcriptional repressor Zur [Candidatus Baumannia cicadellinicola]MCJ7463066.1 zinc uptake transcriptional repressor Zur [Candidatus Baumannia cicadellinicola]